MIENLEQNKEKVIFKVFLLFSLLTLSFLFIIYNSSQTFQKFRENTKHESVAKVDVLEEIVKPKLEKTVNNYKLFEKSNGLIPQAEASFDEIAQASAYILTDLEIGEILLSKNKDEILPIASLTKVMTAVVALDLADPDDVFDISENAASAVPTKLGVETTEKLTLKELLEAILLTSANDAAQVIVEGIDKKYGEKIFVKAMNEKAKFLKLSSSAFANPQGFDSRRNYSSVNDLAILTHYAMTNYSIIEELVKKDEGLLLPNHNHGRFDLPNWNGLIGVYPKTIGMKIGNTRRAGKTTIVISARGGKKLVAIVLGAPGIVERDLWASQLLDYGYETTLDLPPIEVTREQLLAKYQTWND